eukprot:SAG31_NODE_3729_length_3943_cov_6.130593_2_plen_40_part_00
MPLPQFETHHHRTDLVLCFMQHSGRRLLALELGALLVRG